MGLMDGLRKLTQPYGDEEDFFEGADASFAPPAEPEISDSQLQFENAFGAEPSSAPEPAADASSGRRSRFSGGAGGSIFGNLGSSSSSSSSRPAKSRRPSAASSGDQSVVRFNPKNFEEAGELAAFLEEGRSLIMSLEEVPADLARRLLDFMSGIAFAVNGKINPVSAKTYFITPENVDLLDAQSAGSPSEDFE